MTTLRRNILANFMGQGWGMLVNALVVPFYIRLMGIEAYGLIGFYLTLQAIFNFFLDFGLSTTINREIARYSVSSVTASNIKNLVRTLEVGYWLVGVLLGFIVIMTSGWLSDNWINAEHIPLEMIRQTLIVMGLVIIFQWPLSFYQGALQGLQELVLLNRLNAFSITFRTAGALIILNLVQQTILVFFVWQMIASMLQVFLTIFLLWRRLPASADSPRFDVKTLKGIWRFAIGVSLTAFLSFFLSQIDRLVVSKLVTLEMFGYYTVAVTANSALRIISAQISSALFPRFSALIAKGSQDELRRLYHRGSQLTAAFVFPLVFAASFFSFELFSIWTQDVHVATAAAPIASVLFLGTALNSALTIPSNLALAYGRVSLGVYQNLIAVVLTMPLMIFLTFHYGGMGASISWLILNLGAALFVPLAIHHYYLQKELRKWYFKDLVIPLIVAFGASMFFHYFMPVSLSQPLLIAYLLLAGFTVFLLVVLSLGEIRAILFNALAEWMQAGFLGRRG